LVAKAISNQEARQRLIRRLTKKKRVSGPANEDMPKFSSSSHHVISKPWKESKVARSWELSQKSDPVFEVSG